MDVIGAIRGAPVADLGILIGLGVFFFLGVAQGAIRRLIGILSILLAFMVAANLREPLGGFFADNWRQFNSDYNKLLAFVIVFVVVAVASSLITQGAYKRTDLSAEHPIIDDIVGGFLGLVQAMLLLLFIVIILNSYVIPDPAPAGDVTYLHDAQNMLVNHSYIGVFMAQHVAPGFIHVVSFLLPADLVTLFP